MDVRVEIALALVQAGGRWLVSQRATGRVFAGLWEFPGGKIGPDESPGEAAVRETREETGVDVEPIADRGTVVTRHGGRTMVLHLIECRVLGGEARPSDPGVADVRWVDPSQLSDLPMPPANRRIIDRMMAGGSA